MESNVWGNLWKCYKEDDSVSIMNDPGSMTMRSEFIGLLLKFFDLKGKSILDVGTGTGQYCIELAMRGALCLGIDIDVESVKLATRITKDYNAQNGHHCFFNHKDLFNLNNVYFNIVMSMGVLEHEDDEYIIKMLKKMSEIGGYVVVGVPYSGSDTYKLSKAYSIKRGTWEYGAERNFYTMVDLFEKAGIFAQFETVIGGVTEASYLRRINPELIPIQLAQNLSDIYQGVTKVGSWLIAIGSKINQPLGQPRLIAPSISVQNEVTLIPGVSVIIPVHNGEKYIERSIENVKQIKYPNLEVIYVDDGSTDKTYEILKRNGMVDSMGKGLHCHVICWDKNTGVSKARLSGLEYVNNDLVFFLDVDDLVFPDCITNLMRDYVDGVHLPVSCALMEQGKFTGSIWYHNLLNSPEEYLIDGLKNVCGKIALANTIMSRGKLLKAYNVLHELLEKVGIEQMRVAEDSLLLAIMVLSGDISRITPVYYTYRGYEYDTASASHQIEDRVRDIPLFIAYCLKVCKSEKEEKKLLKGMMQTIIRIYGMDYGGKFVDNLKKYRKLI